MRIYNKDLNEPLVVSNLTFLFIPGAEEDQRSEDARAQSL